MLKLLIGLLLRIPGVLLCAAKWLRCVLVTWHHWESAPRPMTPRCGPAWDSACRCHRCVRCGSERACFWHGSGTPYP